MPNKAYIVNDLGYGDSGKGSIVDFLTHKHSIKEVVRFSGGSQAAHNVITPNGKHHKFSQIGAGAFNGARTHLSQTMLVDPITLLDEIDKFDKGYIKDISVNPEAVIITPYHVLANKLRESERKANKHGTCGMGIGETRKDCLDGVCLKVKDLFGPYSNRLKEIQDKKETELGRRFHSINASHIIEFYEEFIGKVKIAELNLNQNLVFEGAQGFLLDETYGFHPYNTWTDVSYNNALEQLKGFDGEIVKLGLIRSYMTRHGAGPFVTESKSLNRPENHNKHNPWQDGWRVGYLDLVAIKYAIDQSGGIDGLVISHLDMLEDYNSVCVGYTNISEESYSGGNINFRGVNDNLTKELFEVVPVYQAIRKDEFIDFVEDFLGVKAKILSYGPTREDKIEV